MGLFAPPSFRNNDASTGKLEAVRAARCGQTSLGFRGRSAGRGVKRVVPPRRPTGAEGDISRATGYGLQPSGPALRRKSAFLFPEPGPEASRLRADYQPPT